MRYRGGAAPPPPPPRAHLQVHHVRAVQRQVRLRQHEELLVARVLHGGGEQRLGCRAGRREQGKRAAGWAGSGRRRSGVGDSCAQRMRADTPSSSIQCRAVQRPDASQPSNAAPGTAHCCAQHPSARHRTHQRPQACACPTLSSRVVSRAARARTAGSLACSLQKRRGAVR